MRGYHARADDAEGDTEAGNERASPITPLLCVTDAQDFLKAFRTDNETHAQDGERRGHQGS